MSHTMPSLVAAILLGFVSALPAVAQTYNATADYSTVNNPNGVWSSGFKTALTGSLDLYEVSNSVVAPGSHLWQDSVINVLNTPTFFKSFTSTAGGQIIGSVHLHGGPNNEFSTLRFTAPTAGVYDIAAEWFNGDTGETSAHVVLNNTTTLFTDNATSDGALYAGTVSLASGDFVEVSVGTAGSFFSDTTPFSLTITNVTVVPEAGTLTLLGFALLPVGIGVARRRK